MRVKALTTHDYRGALVFPGCTFTLADPAHFDGTWMRPDALEPEEAPRRERDPQLTEDPETARTRARLEHRRIRERVAAGGVPD